MSLQYRGPDYYCCDAAHTHTYLFPTLLKILATRDRSAPIFELGCGNGSTAAALADHGYTVEGVDPLPSRIELARRDFPRLSLHLGSTDEDLGSRFGRFQTLISLEVIEHVSGTARFIKAIDELLVPGGMAIISTPYHGYMKNLALAVTGMMDRHFTALWEGGHIKFWSRKTLRIAFQKIGGFSEVGFYRVGRIPPLANSMIVVYQKPK